MSRAVFRPLFLTLLAAAFAAAALGGWPARFDDRSLSFTVYQQKGECLLHRVPCEDPAGYMPLASTLAARLGHAAAPWDAGWTAVLLAGIPLLAFALGALVHSRTAGLLAGFIAIFADYSGLDHYQYAVYAVLVLWVAGVLAWRAGRPSAWRAVLAGAAIGLSLLFRSPLLLLPLALVVLEGAFTRGDRSSRWLLLGYAWLLPWVAMNAALTGEFIPFERGEADAVVMAGALGQTLAPVDAPGRIADTGTGYGDALAWAVSETLRHPLRFLSGYASRLAFVVSRHPFLIVGALLALLLLRRRPEARAAGGLLLYYAAIHGLPAVSENHFLPFYLIAAVLASAALVSAVGGPPASAMESRAPALVLLGGYGLLFAFLAVLAGWSALRYGAAALRGLPEQERLAAARRHAPADGWLALREGIGRLDAGDGSGARRPLAQALLERPRDPHRALAYGWALALQGLPTHRLHLVRPSDFPVLSPEARQAHVLRALGFLRAGLGPQAAAEVGAARRVEAALRTFPAAPGRSDPAPSLADALPAWFDGFSDRAGLAAALARLAPDDDALRARLER